MCRSDGWIGLSSTRTSASPRVKGGVGTSASSNTLFGSPVSRKISALINTSSLAIQQSIPHTTSFRIARLGLGLGRERACVTAGEFGGRNRRSADQLLEGVGHA